MVLEALDQFGAVHIKNASRAVRVVGQDRQLPTLPGACIDSHSFENDRQESGSDLFAGGHDRVVFARIMQHGCLAAPFNQLVGDSRHCGNNDRHIVAGIDLALDVPRHIADAVKIGDGCSAEFHHQSSHDSPGCAEGPLTNNRCKRAGSERRPEKARIHTGGARQPQHRRCSAVRLRRTMAK